MRMFDLSFLWKAEQTHQQGLSIPVPKEVAIEQLLGPLWYPHPGGIFEASQTQGEWRQEGDRKEG